MRFWDASALVPFLIDEPTSAGARAALAVDRLIVTWWGTAVECASAVTRGEREGRIVIDEVVTAIRNLEALRAGWTEIEPSVVLRESALRLLRVHPLRAADALQLAAASVAAEGQPRSLPFVTLDDHLAVAADREGFPVVHFDRSPSA